jgi:hypothetical protein
VYWLSCCVTPVTAELCVVGKLCWTERPRSKIPIVWVMASDAAAFLVAYARIFMASAGFAAAVLRAACLSKFAPLFPPPQKKVTSG